MNVTPIGRFPDEQDGQQRVTPIGTFPDERPGSDPEALFGQVFRRLPPSHQRETGPAALAGQAIFGADPTMDSGTAAHLMRENVGRFFFSEADRGRYVTFQGRTLHDIEGDLPMRPKTVTERWRGAARPGGGENWYWDDPQELEETRMGLLEFLETQDPRVAQLRAAYGDSGLLDRLRHEGELAVGQTREERPTVGLQEATGDLAQFIGGVGAVKSAGRLGVRALGKGAQGVAKKTPGMAKEAAAVAAADAAIQGGQVATGKKDDVDLRQSAAAGLATPVAGAIGKLWALGGRGLASSGSGKWMPPRTKRALGELMEATSTPAAFAAFGQANEQLAKVLGSDQPKGEDLPWMVDLAKILYDSAVVGGLSKVAPSANPFESVEVAKRLRGNPKIVHELVRRGVLEAEAAERMRPQVGEEITTLEGKKETISEVTERGYQTKEGSFVPRRGARGGVDTEVFWEGFRRLASGAKSETKSRVTRESIREHQRNYQGKANDAEFWIYAEKKGLENADPYRVIEEGRPVYAEDLDAAMVRAQNMQDAYREGDVVVMQTGGGRWDPVWRGDVDAQAPGKADLAAVRAAIEATKPDGTGLVPIHELRAHVEKHAPDSAAAFNGAVRELWQAGEVRQVPISTRSEMTPEQLEASIPASRGTMAYLEPVQGQVSTVGGLSVEPFRGRAFRGQGTGSMAAHGRGEYYGLDRGAAELFSKKGTVKESAVEAQRTLRVRSDADLRALKQQAEKETGGDFGKTGSLYEMLSREAEAPFTEWLRGKGIDGLVIDYPEAAGGRQFVDFRNVRTKEIGDFHAGPDLRAPVRRAVEAVAAAAGSTATPRSREIVQRQRAVSVIRSAVESKPGDRPSEIGHIRVDGREVSGIEAQNLWRAIEKGSETGGPRGKGEHPVEVESVKAVGWQGGVIKLKDGRVVESRHPDDYGRHAMIMRQLGAKPPPDIDHARLAPEVLSDMIARRLPAAADRLFTGVFGEWSANRALRRWATEFSENPALDQLSAGARKRAMERNDRLHAAEWQLKQVLEKYPADAQAQILTALHAYHEGRGKLPHRLVRDKGDLRRLDSAVRLTRSVFMDLRDNTWIPYGYMTPASAAQFMLPSGESGYQPRTYARPEGRDARPSGFAGGDATWRILNPRTIQQQMGHFRQRQLTYDEALRSGLITDYRATLEQGMLAVRAGRQVEIFGEIAKDPTLFQQSNPFPDVEVRRLADAKDAEKAARSDAAKARIPVRGELDTATRRKMTATRSSFRRAMRTLQADPTPENLAKARAAETRWFRHVRREKGMTDAEFQVYLDGMIGGKPAKDAAALDIELHRAINERVRIEEGMAEQWVKLPDNKVFGPLSRKVDITVDGETKTVWEGGWVRRELYDSVVKPQERRAWMKAYFALHAFLKKQKTARNAGTWLVNRLSNRVGTSMMGVDTISKDYRENLRLAERQVRSYMESGDRSMTKAEQKSLRDRGIDPVKWQEGMDRFFEAGFVQGGGFQAEIGGVQGGSVREARAILEEAQAKGQSTALARLNVQAQRYDEFLREGLGPFSGAIRWQEANYASSDPAQAAAALQSMFVGRGTKDGRALPWRAAASRVRALLDYGDVPLGVRATSHAAVSFARVFYMLPRGVVRNLFNPTKLSSILAGKKPRARKAMISALTAAAQKAITLAAPMFAAHAAARELWFGDLPEEEAADEYRLALKKFGYGSEKRAWWVVPVFGADEPTFVDWGRYHPMTQVLTWGLELADVLSDPKRWSGRGFATGLASKHLMFGPLSQGARGVNFYGVPESEAAWLGGAASSALLPGTAEATLKAGERMAKDGSGALPPEQAIPGIVGIRARTADEWGRNQAAVQEHVDDTEGVDRIEISVVQMIELRKKIGKEKDPEKKREMRKKLADLRVRLRRLEAERRRRKREDD